LLHIGPGGVAPGEEEESAGEEAESEDTKSMANDHGEKTNCANEK
jgi:hypothetical protein